MTVAEKRMARVVDWGIAARPFPGETESGDRAIVLPSGGGIVLAVADGLGHGSSAAQAAEVAVEAVRCAPDASLSTVLACCHERLERTRGAAVSLARLEAGVLSWIGIGNVEGRLLRPAGGRLRAESLLLMPGLVGHSLPHVRARETELEFGDTLVLATDGIRASFADDLDLSGTADDVARRILTAHARSTDDALVLVARYIGGIR